MGHALYLYDILGDPRKKVMLKSVAYITSLILLLHIKTKLMMNFFHKRKKCNKYLKLKKKKFTSHEKAKLFIMIHESVVFLYILLEIMM